jgi:hypothetical protein
MKMGMKTIVIILAIVIFNNCQKNTYSSENGLPPLLFPNIQEANRYIRENMKSNDIDYILLLNTLHTHFMNTEDARLMGYNWYSGIILADLDGDGTYELYLNASTGSGFIHFFIHGYNPITNEYYVLSNRMAANYKLFIYKNNLYVYANNSLNNTLIYRPIITDGELLLVEIEEIKKNKIMKTVSIESIFSRVDFGLARDNDFRFMFVE